MFGAALRNGFGGLLRFSGRDRPAMFWIYAGIVLGGAFAAWLLAFAAQFRGFTERVNRIAAEHPEDVIIDQGPGHYSVQIKGWHPELMPDFAGLLQTMTVIATVVAILLAAAVTRRLHDSNVRGWFALVPCGLLFLGLYLMGTFFNGLNGQAEPDLSAFFTIFAVNLAYLASLGGLVYLLVRGGTVGENRFGPPSF